MMMIKVLENLAYEERLKEVRSLLPCEQKAQGTLSQYSQSVSLSQKLQVLQGSYKEDRGSLLTRSHVKMTRGNKCKLHWKASQHKMFLQGEQSFTRTTSPGTQYRPHHWWFSRSDWTECQIISPRLPLSLGQMGPYDLWKPLLTWAAL